MDCYVIGQMSCGRVAWGIPDLKDKKSGATGTIMPRRASGRGSFCVFASYGFSVIVVVGY